MGGNVVEVNSKTGNLYEMRDGSNANISNGGKTDW